MATVEREHKLRGGADVLCRLEGKRPEERRQGRRQRGDARLPRSWRKLEHRGRKTWF